MSGDDETSEMRKRLREVQSAMNAASTDRDYRKLYVKLCTILGPPVREPIRSVREKEA